MGQLSDARRRRALRAAPALGVAVLVLAACGTHAPRPAAQTTIRTVSAHTRGGRSCLQLVRWAGPAPRIGVERAGRLGRSLTMRAGPAVIGCDAAANRRASWCAGAVGLVRDGLLVDPRLTLTCRDASGRHLGFGWIEAVRGASWIEVGSVRVSERYAVGGRAPVRVATTDVRLDSAVFDVVQYAADGHELERRRITMHSAG